MCNKNSYFTVLIQILDRDCSHWNPPSSRPDLPQLRHLRQNPEVSKVSTTSRQHHHIPAKCDRDANDVTASHAPTAERHDAGEHFERQPKSPGRLFNNDDNDDEQKSCFLSAMKL